MDRTRTHNLARLVAYEFTPDEEQTMTTAEKVVRMIRKSVILQLAEKAEPEVATWLHAQLEPGGQSSGQAGVGRCRTRTGRLPINDEPGVLPQE